LGSPSSRVQPEDISIAIPNVNWSPVIFNIIIILTANGISQVGSDIQHTSNTSGKITRHAETKHTTQHSTNNKNTTYTKNTMQIKLINKLSILYTEQDSLCGLVVRVLGYDSTDPGSIPGTTRKK
jgi:hypothetical protein